ncbi:ShlB/FhaC/HecB family hemolysin secretion/activation protein [Rodentibacter pneumotropicus]|uniref:ShlB/FhaC/HecB family hemolysin secretion/activation protein n=1 Tax=Rodentibacter pneumotropicus TaxID=758 RepID=A0A4S2P7M8_9PAST|nr:ShlB/FhaC/HecB family hemolysin secretion/activation protein [Rodentibacter pneumotropicus]TGZ98958.1 ShlB/FhaC/HecB family hemolysin secretion/activation protein [Rodentibacter pneumotropicus]TGZ99428.1 ShlB/FhaC/HecB family hemolysin secretion/activation protein [Rodentibacter pneumotropicus]THA12243.1 ShlB/FhaC/HecB family hemolysin secretion/activation protein [Rodentibacter pneumotropicus]
MKPSFSFLTLSTLFIFPSSLYAVPNRLPTEAEKQVIARQQRQQVELNSEIQARQVQDPHVSLEMKKISSTTFPRQEAQCFPINQLVLTDFNANEANPKFIQPSRFHWALNAVYVERDFALPACIGSEGINVLLRRIQNRLIDFGYVTTRVLVEPQDLRSGMLVLSVIPGKVGRIQLQDQSAIPFATRGTLWFAMPMAQGDILNVRDIEQGLENLKRIPSADANIELIPSEEVGETDVVIQYKQTLPFHLTLGLDDSGTKATGRLQGSATFSWDNVFTLNDMFYISGTRSFKRDSDNAEGDYGSKNLSLYYSIPWKNYLLTLSGSRYTYHQTIAGAFESYQYSGESQQMNAKISRLLSRGSQYKTYINTGVWTRKSSNFINDTEVEVQRRRTAGWEVGLNHTHYIGNATLQLSAHYKRGTGAYRALSAPEETFGEGTSRMQILTASIDVTYPFTIANQVLSFNTSWNAQWNQTPLVQQDKFSIGGRYTVRGFDGELTLSGESGWLWRNEFAWNIMNKGQELYIGIDKGVVRSHQEELQVGNRLTGGVIGVRGKLWGINYEYFVGTPIKKPQGFRTSHVTTGFNLSYRF